MSGFLKDWDVNKVWIDGFLYLKKIYIRKEVKALNG
jgi:hypothetical protein